MTLSIKNILFGILAIVVGSWAVYTMTQPVKSAPSFISNIITTATTSTAYSVLTNTRILATTTNALGNGTSYTRIWASICNPSATIVALNMNADKPVTASSTTVFIGAATGYSACYEITDRNLYQGSVQASSTVGTVRVFVTSYVQ